MNIKNDGPNPALNSPSQGEKYRKGHKTLMAEQWESLSPAEAKQLFHELQVHQFELKMQNDELLRAQNELDIAKSRYFDLYDLAPVGYCTLDKEGLVLEANFTATSMLKVTRETLINQSITKFIVREDQDIYYFHRKKLIETHEAQFCELRMLRADGTTFWAHLFSRAFNKGEEHWIIISDISNRKFQEEERELTTRLALCLSASGDFRECMAGLTGDLQGWSGCEAVGIRLQENDDFPYFETRGFPPEFVQGESHLYSYDANGEVLRDPTGRPLLKCVCGDVLQGRFDAKEPYYTSRGSFWSNGASALIASTTRADSSNQIKIGCTSERYESVALIPLHYGEQVFGLLQFNDHRPDRFTPGMIEHFEKMADSLSIALSRRLAEEEKTRLQAQFIQAQKMESLGCLAGGVAHDMNNVLSAILGLASANKKLQPPDSSAHEAFDTIVKAARRGGKMVQSLLGFAHRSPTDIRELSLNQILEEGIHILECTTLSKISLEKELAPDLRHMAGDANTLTHAFMNLFVNAVDAMSGNSTLTIKTRNIDQDWIEVLVKDTGMGMSKEILEKAVDPFFTTKEQGKGTGLGLSMVYNTVKSHQGHLEIQSELSKGTSVIIRFPACESTTSVLEPAIKQNDASKASASLNVLIVDDDNLVRQSLSEVVNTLNHQATMTSSGEEALKKLEAGLMPDVVILDLNMPGLGGPETLARLRRLRPSLPVILSTGKVDKDVQILANGYEFITILFKPFSIEELEEHLALFKKPS